ncbi:MAG: transposase zinc-binding domain-containing protein, partial [SAR202 cluster bacterium]|nr:transposase zinc-binding domain-containing protein [SAR202 cluster bacterium]
MPYYANRYPQLEKKRSSNKIIYIGGGSSKNKDGTSFTATAEEIDSARNELADIIHRYQSDYLSKHKAGSQVLKTLKAIKVCRTAVLGGNKKECSKCKAIKISYNSCRNRHCPKCQAVARERWIKARESELLDVPYF